MHVKTRVDRSQAGPFRLRREMTGQMGIGRDHQAGRIKGAGFMKKVVLSLATAFAVSAVAPAFAADMPAKAPKVAPAPPPSPWDIAFGSALMTDYIFRGVTQSGHNGSVAAYFEPRYNINANWQLYAGISGESIKFANNAAAGTDFSVGVRSTCV